MHRSPKRANNKETIRHEKKGTEMAYQDFKETVRKSYEEIDPERFLYGNYEPNYWSRLGIGYDYTQTALEQALKDRIVGWCDSSRLMVRPKTGTIAVMCEDDELYLFWFHL